MNGSWNAALSVARELRRFPAIRTVYERSDPLLRARRLVSSGVLDTGLYADQLGIESISAADAAAHYVSSGHLMGLTINALLDDEILRKHLTPSGRPRAYDYLWLKDWRTPVSSQWDAQEYLAQHPDAATHPFGPVGHVWERVQREADVTVPLPTGGTAGASDIIRRHRAASIEWARGEELRQARRLSHSAATLSDFGQWPDEEPRPLVSIVLATWNRSGPLRDSVESARAQTWEHWELIIVDDGSWDDTPAIAALLSSRDPRVKYVPREHAGVSAARNAALAEAKGDFVAFLDSDNSWTPTFIESMMLGMRASESAVAFATIEMDNDDTRLFREAAAAPEVLALGNVVDLNTLVVRRDALDLIGGFDTNLRRAVDYDLILRLSAKFTIAHIPTIGAIYSNRTDGDERISTTEPLGWNTHVRLKSLIDWPAVAKQQLAEGAYVCVIVASRDPLLDEKLAVLRSLSSKPGVAIHVVLLAPSPSDWVRARATADTYANITAHLFPQPEPFTYVVSTMLKSADRDRFVVIEPTSQWSAADVEALIDAVDPDQHRIVAPLLRHADGTIVTVGAGFPKRSAPPVDLLSRHPWEDAHALGAEITVPALSGRTFGVPTSDLVEIEGLEPLLYNEYELPMACVALAAHFGAYPAVTLSNVTFRRTVLATDFARIDRAGSLTAARSLTSQVEPTDFNALYAPLGLRVDHFRPVRDHESALEEQLANGQASGIHHLHPVVVRSRRNVKIDNASIPSLRWAIRIAAPAFPRGGAWGDEHFARSLARGLESWGQEVVVDHHEVTVRPTAYLDDVTIVIRGLDRVEPATGGVSMLWIISHPDLVTRNEVALYDHVFAASNSWAEKASERWHRPVQTLLQCTDPTIFHPQQQERDNNLVFVGKSRGVARPAVVYPLRAGIPLNVYGGEWEGIIPPEAVRSTYVENSELGQLYSRSAAVLNDHWNDMRRDGFISNRLFDVVASQGRVFTDRVDGVDDVFGDAVVQYDSPLELVEMLKGNIDDLFPDDQELARQSTRIREEHSFRARARTLIDRALQSLDRN